MVGVVRGDALNSEFWKRRSSSCLSMMRYPAPGGVTRRANVKSDEEVSEAKVLEFFFNEQTVCREMCCMTRELGG